ncbi:MAG: 1-acyl-sn-glycerol-3-phosphate acyltransferase [Cellvibrionaceae bacterium]|jgi:1-acyl-sn-glycerol-3-phosphate acyltransferase
MVQKLSKSILRLFGWKVVGERPDANKYIAVCAPHTSNFDALWFFMAMMALQERPKVLIKSSFYRFPIKRAFLAVGGIPVERGIGAKNLAQQMVQYMGSVERGALMLAPEGSRSLQKFWKIGFYQIAQATTLPIYFAYADYGKKELGIYPAPLWISGNVAEDMEVVRGFYTDIVAKHPERVGPIRLKRE